MSGADEQQMPAKQGGFWKCLSLLVALAGLYTAIRGEVAFGGHALYLEGMHARVAGVIWMSVFLLPVFKWRQF